MLWRTRPATEEALRVAAELVDSGFSVALEPHGDGVDLAGLCARVVDAGLGPHCELTLRADPLGTDEVAGLAATGVAVALAGPRDAVTAAALRVPSARILVPAEDPGAESWCRVLADARVRLTQGRGTRADLAFVRCLNVLMAGGGHPAVATADPRLVAITGERAAWNDRTPDSWEHVMPYRATFLRRTLVAGGYAVRVVLPAAGTARR